MLKRLFLFVFATMLPFFGASQCLVSDTLATQDAIDSFSIHYPNCHAIQGNVVISGSQITNLDGLLGIDTITGSLIIQQTQLANLVGLDSLRDIGNHLTLKFNQSLQNVSGLDNLQSIGGTLSLIYNNALTEISDLTELDSIGISIVAGENDALTSLEGLENLHYLGYELVIEGNDSLKDLVGLTGLTTIGSNLKIRDNNNLETLTGLGQISFIHDNLEIWNNPKLKEISGLSALGVVQKSIQIVENQSLQDLTGLDQIQSLSGFLEIIDNDSLTSLAGLNSLDSIGDFLSIWKNPQLENIEALADLDYIYDFVFIKENDQLASLSGMDYCELGNAIVIRDNPVLSICGIPSICEFLTYGNVSIIQDNAPGCDSELEIENTCGQAVLQGQVYFDSDQNCLGDSLETGLSDWIIEATDGLNVYYGLSDTSGRYKIFLPVGNYQVHPVPPSVYWEAPCQGSVSVVIQDNTDVDTVDFVGQLVVECPQLKIDLSGPDLRPCEAAPYQVVYENIGTFPGQGAYATVQFHEFIVVDSASADFSILGNNTFEFLIGDIETAEKGHFTIYTHVSCLAIESQALCAQAHIYPDSFCLSNPNWSGASLAVEATCASDSVTFIIKNDGEADMTEYVQGIIIEDQVMGLTSEIILDQGESETIKLPKNGSTYYLMTNQVNSHPGNSMPRAVLEGCGMNDVGEFSTGHVLPYPEDDANLFVSIDCKEVIGADDTLWNRKNNFPKGYLDPHYIDIGQEVEYLTSFQNKQADTIWNIVIEDVVSPHLDIATLVVGASSHPYRLKILGDTLQFQFDTIGLPPDSIDLVHSTGFIKFKLQQKPNLPVGTVITNQASVYFQKDDPVTTNEVYNTIGQDYLIVDITSPLPQNVNVMVKPNPMHESVVIELEGVEMHQGELSIFTADNRLIAKKPIDSNKIMLLRNELPAGIVFFTIQLDNQQIVHGRITVL